MFRNYTARQAAHVIKKAEACLPEEMKNFTALTGVTDRSPMKYTKDIEEFQQKWQHNLQAYGN